MFQNIKTHLRLKHRDFENNKPRPLEKDSIEVWKAYYNYTPTEKA
jgi:hypothetical protein